ncbi:GH25 family lysozyme [uncultured Arcticibacterium sp.]|uniref:glycoside hydrolase family 25 protein n=1 Tax=uncultured Arcticibacterium sp. TaxID=2173042 RepID=UPI0030F57B16
MKKRKNNSTVLDRLLNKLWRLKTLYALTLLFLLVWYPSSVIDGMRNSDQQEEVKVRIPLKYKTHGIDVSHHNGDIDWDKVSSYNKHRSSVRFCFVKATEGIDFVDKRFQDNWFALGEKDIRRGAYHFFNPQTDPRLQALNFILNVDLEKGDLAPVLDWETLGYGRNRRQIVQNVGRWLEIIEKHYGIKPIIYTNKHIYLRYVRDNFPDYPLWISQYEVPQLEGYDLSKVYFWQHSMKGKLEGIESSVDFNVFMRDDFEIERLTLR